MAKFDDMLLDLVQDEKITQDQYQTVTGCRFTNIRRILPRSNVRTLLIMQREIDRIHGRLPVDDDNSPGAA